MSYSKERYHSDPEYREARKAYRRRAYRARKEREPDFLSSEAARMRARRANALPAERAEENAKRKARGTRGPHKRKVVAAKPAIVRATKPALKKVPFVVRDAWRRAAPGSIIRLKYPDPRSLERAARNGAFDQVAA
jgi:hypothetical protein